MYKKSVCILILFLSTIPAAGSDFAANLVSYKNLHSTGLYDDPNSVLGKPTRWIRGLGNKTYACSLVYPAYNTDPNGNKLITTIVEDANIVVKFDHRISDDQGNPYGTDFLVFGNSFFRGDGFLTPDTDMAKYLIAGDANESAEPVKVSVAQNAGGPWFTFSNGPYGDSPFPTNAFLWNRDVNDWGAELDWLKPIDPALNTSDFIGCSVADAIESYDGSAGGTGFDLKDLDPNDYAALAVDPNTGRKWIQYIKVEYLPGGDYEGEIDGFADVAGGGDYQHPAGDLNIDGKVDYSDLALLGDYWLCNITGYKNAGVIADLYEDGIVNFRDFAMLAGNWRKCTIGCN
jgi:hypothetical protein